MVVLFIPRRSVPFRHRFVVSFQSRLRRHGRQRIPIANEEFFLLVRCEEAPA